MSHPSSPVTSALPALTKEFLLELGGWKAAKEGRALAEAGKVTGLRFDPPLLQGEIKSGGSTVRARLKLGARLVDAENLCSCRQAQSWGTMCAHALALGYAVLAARAQPATPARPSAPAAPPAPQAVPAQKRSWIAWSEADSGVAPLEIAVLLPLDLPKAWKSGAMRILLEGQTPGGSGRPLDAVLAGGTNTFAVSESDARLLQEVERLNRGALPGMWELQAAAFDRFFQSLHQHPRVGLGKRERVTVAAPGTPLPVPLHLEHDGRLRLGPAARPQAAGTELGLGWWLDGTVLSRHAALPAAYRALFDGPVWIERTALPAFLEREWPSLVRDIEPTWSESSAALEFRRDPPTIRATVEGSAATLSVRAESHYGSERFPVRGAAQTTGSDGWLPDAAVPTRFWWRSLRAESQAADRITAAGFAPSRHDPAVFVLQSEPRALQFLAEILPDWRRDWDVTVGARLTGFLDQCDQLTPHFEFQASGEDWLAMDVSLCDLRSGARYSLSEVKALLGGGPGAKRRGARRPLISPRAVEDLEMVLRDCDVRQSPGQPMQVDARCAAFVAEAARDSGWDLANRTAWRPPGDMSASDASHLALAPELDSILRPYQRAGVAWLVRLADSGLGAILADDMGLGKTLQTLAYLSCRPSDRPSLVVCPTSLVANWAAETERFVPAFKTIALHGPGRDTLFSELPRARLVITSYALLRRDLDRLKSIDFDTVILDEAQHIKNPFSQSAQAAKAVRAERRIVLTGTPIENALGDLWSITDFLMPGYLGSHADFRERYEQPIQATRDASALRRLRQRMKPIVLRRTKAEVAPELPERIDQIRYCDLSPDQAQVYAAVLQEARREAVEAAGAKGSAASRMKVLTAILRLRQACCHLGLLPRPESTTWNEPSAKLDAALDLLDEALSGGHRVLVFSQFAALLRLVAAALNERSIAHLTLDGSTTDRAGVIRTFQTSDTPVFLISLKAGGTGLNLTGADTVLHFDPWWNPAAEEQATARAHRIGQTRVVTSIKLIARGTIEEKVLRLQERKRWLAQETLLSEESFVERLTWTEIDQLIS